MKKTTFFLSTSRITDYLCSAKSEGWQVCGDPAIAPTGAADERLQRSCAIKGA